MFHPQPLDWEVVESHNVELVQVLFKEDGVYPTWARRFTTDAREWTSGVKIRQIAPNAISGSYTFDMHQSAPPASPGPRPMGSAAEVGRPRPISDPGTSRNENADTTSHSTNKLHRKSRSAAASPKAVSNPFTFGILKRTTPPPSTPSKEELAISDAPDSEPERRRSFGATFSFLQPRHGRDRLGSRSSTSSTSSRASTSGSEDGEAMERGSGAKSVPAVRKEKQAQPPSPTTHHSARSYLPIVRSEPPLASNHGPTPPTDVVPSSRPTLVQPGYHKAQMKKVLKHSRAELMKEVRKAGYNVLVVEG